MSHILNICLIEERPFKSKTTYKNISIMKKKTRIKIAHTKYE